MNATDYNQAIRSEIDYNGGALFAWISATVYTLVGIPWYGYALMATFVLVYGAWRVRRLSRRFA
jgi:hypothetical protein